MTFRFRVLAAPPLRDATGLVEPRRRRGEDATQVTTFLQMETPVQGTEVTGGAQSSEKSLKFDRRIQ